MTSTGQMMVHLDQPHRLADCLASQEKFSPLPSHSDSSEWKDKVCPSSLQAWFHIHIMHLPPLNEPSCSGITIDLVCLYHRCSTNCPYGRSCPLLLSPTSNDFARFFPGNMRYAESHISSSPLVCDMCFGSVSSSASHPIQSVPSPGLSYKTTT